MPTSQPNQRSFQRGFAATSWLLAGWLMISGLVGVFDSSEHAHTICQEHGDFVHSETTIGAPAPSSQEAIAQSAHHELLTHEHCAYALTIRTQLLPFDRASGETQWTDLEVWRVSAEIGSEKTERIYLYAPMNSPPRA